MSLTQEQIANRQFAVGGSESAIALGISPRKTALELYMEKRGDIVPQWEDSEETWWGRMLEPIVRQKYAERTGRTVYLPEGSIFHPEHEFMVAHIDGFSEDAHGGDRRGYEGKTAYHSTGWGDEGSDAIPQDYLIQVHHYITVTALPVFDVATLIGRRFAFYQVLPDAELRDMIIEGCRDFIRRVREGDPPPLDYQHRTAIDVVKKLYPGTNNQRLVATEDAIAWRTSMQEHAGIEKAAEAQKDAYKARLLESMGEAALLAFPDGKAFRRQKSTRAGYVVNETEVLDCRFVNDPALPKRGKKR